MNLGDALRIANTEVEFPGRSDKALVERIKDPGRTAAVIVPAAGLDNPEALPRLRPVDALLQLAVATRPRYRRDVLGMYLWWGLLRYLGFFETSSEEASGQKALRVSPAGQAIVGRQRSVASEDLGIGFGVLLARHWLRHSGIAHGAINIIDVDVALESCLLKLQSKSAGNRSRRPDYLIHAYDPSLGCHYVRVLECKGTIDGKRADKQLASAVEQLGAATVAGCARTGLAVSTITSSDQVLYKALECLPVADPSTLADPYGRVDVGIYRSGDPILGELLDRSLRGALSTLADFCGDPGLASRWAPGDTRDQPRSGGEPVRYETPYGSALGTSFPVPFGLRTLWVTYAIRASVYEAMITLDRMEADRGEFRQIGSDRIQHVVEAQAEFAEEQHAGSYSPSAKSSDDSAHAAAPDGSILLLTLKDPRGQ